MEFVRKAIAAVGSFCVLGAAGTDQRFAEIGRMPPDSVWKVFLFGMVLIVLAIIWRKK